MYSLACSTFLSTHAAPLRAASRPPHFTRQAEYALGWLLRRAQLHSWPFTPGSLPSRHHHSLSQVDRQAASANAGPVLTVCKRIHPSAASANANATLSCPLAQAKK